MAKAASADAVYRALVSVLSSRYDIRVSYVLDKPTKNFVLGVAEKQQKGEVKNA